MDIGGRHEDDRRMLRMELVGTHHHLLDV